MAAMFYMGILLFIPLLPFLVAIGGLLAIPMLLRARKVRTRWVITVMAIWMLLFLFGPIVAHRLFNIKSYSAKEGRVVDADSGQGIPDAFVIAEGVITESGGAVEARTATEPEYRIVVRTDASGNYSIPASWSHALPWWWIGPLYWTGSTYHDWRVMAFKPGYVASQDEKSPIRDSGNPGYRLAPEPVTFTPPNRWRGFHVEILPLTLRKQQLTLTQMAGYYRSFESWTTADFEMTPVENEKLLNSIYHYLLPIICSIDPETKLPYDVATFAIDSPKSYREVRERLKQLEPEGFDKHPGAAVFLGETEHPNFLAKNVCEAMKTVSTEL